MNLDTRQYDTDIIDAYGTSAENAYFIEDMVKPHFDDAELSCYFAASDNSEVTIWFEVDDLLRIDYHNMSVDDIEQMSHISVKSFDDGEHKEYSSDDTGTALQQYCDEHPDVKLSDIETYSEMAFEKYLKNDAESALSHCNAVIDQFNQSANSNVFHIKQFNAGMLCDIRDTMQPIYSKAVELGIDIGHTSLGGDALHMDKRRLESGLFAENVEWDMYSDMYKDQYGHRPRHMKVGYISTAQEQERKQAVLDYTQSKDDMGKSIIDTPSFDSQIDMAKDSISL